ncbi:DNA helicase [Pleomorphomonas oryzae]|uniref:DNA helicase n=1 Tax=Pleomorphomonas oryzae TaxID=261934 RepID=UPI000413CEB0|nr:DNA helicase [Pleomorphomonas oryzae]
MKLSAPIFQLKRRAKLMARAGNLPLHEALDKVAREEGFARWSLLSSTMAAGSLSQTVLSRLDDGDLLLMAGRPGQGKTLLGLQLLLDAVRAGRRALFFTLEYTEPQARGHLRKLATPADLADKVEVVTTEAIGADLIMAHMADAAPGSVAVVDYLQILDQQRSKPPLADQIAALSAFAKDRGLILGFISQIDRAFDPEAKRLPDIGDIRLPNLVDLGLFTKACFLHNGEAQLQNVA